MMALQHRCPCGAPGRTSPLSLLPVLAGGLLIAARVGIAQVPSPSQAQQALQQAVQQNPGLPDIIRQRIQQSGLTPEQVRARLAMSGYPTNLLDAYLGPPLPGGALPVPGALELGAVQALGLSLVPSSQL